MTRLSEHFYLNEFLRSETASRMGREIAQPPPAIVSDLTRLCVLVLEPVRTALGNRAITILSGWRPLWLNQAVGGSVKSEHMDGRAADILVAGLTPTQVCLKLEPLLIDLPVNQMILEFPPNGWTHISVAAEESEPRRQALTATKVGRSTHYINGITGEKAVA